MRHNGQISLGYFIELLSARPVEQDVYFDVLNLVPTNLDSYRGYYEDLAIGFSLDGRCLVGALLAECRAAVGAEYQGYKGGEYIMDEDTALWVSNWGRCGNLIVTGVDAEREYSTYITTRIEP